MRIVSATTDVLQLPFRDPVVTAQGVWSERRIGLVRLVTDDGSEGLGEVATERPDVLGETCCELAELSGGDPRDTSWVEARLADAEASLPHGRALRSALEAAIVDLVARAAGIPVAGALGAVVHASVAVNGMVGAAPADVAAARARDLVIAGYGVLKIKAGAEPIEAILARVEAVRAAVGTGVRLRLDLNGSLDVNDAAELLGRSGELGLEYVEQPIAPAVGANALAELRRASPVPIAADESVGDHEAAQHLLDAEAADVLVLKPARLGGVRSTRQIAEMAFDREVGVTVSTLFETGVGIAAALHLAASLPGEGTHGLATADVLASDLLRAPLAIVEGHMVLPPGAGLGIDLDTDAVERFRAP